MRNRIREEVFAGASRTLSSSNREAKTMCSVGVPGQIILNTLPLLMHSLLKSPSPTLERCHGVLQACAHQVILATKSISFELLITINA